MSAIQETWVQSLGQEDALEKGIATHSSIVAWEIPWTEEPGGLQSMGSQRVGHDERLSLHSLISIIITSAPPSIYRHLRENTHFENCRNCLSVTTLSISGFSGHIEMSTG